MLKKIISAVLSISLILPITHSQAAIKVGGTCKKIGSIANQSKEALICTKKGTKLVWVKETKTTITTPSQVGTSFNLTIGQGSAVNIVDMDMVNNNVAIVTSDYIKKVNESVPGFAKQICDSLLKGKSEVIIKDGVQTLGVSFYKPIVVFSQKTEELSRDGHAYPNWEYMCFFSADFNGMKKVPFYEIYVNGNRIATEPYANLVNSQFRLLYPSIKPFLCITTNNPSWPVTGLLSSK